MTSLSYDEFIDNILKTRGRYIFESRYKERHHIVPKCLGGTNKKENLIDLLPEEHYMAHKLLAQENPDNYKLQYAWWNMAQCKGSMKKRFTVTKEEYALAREAKSKFSTGELNPCYGRKHTDEEKILMRKNHKDFTGKNHPHYGKKLSEETKQKISKAHTGKVCPWMVGDNSPIAKKVVCEGVVYDSILACAQHYGVYPANLSAYLNGRRKMPQKWVERGFCYFIEKEGDVIL